MNSALSSSMTERHQTRDDFCVRPMTLRDNAAVKALVIDTLEEFGCVGPGFSSSDPMLGSLYDLYRLDHPAEHPDRIYWVIEERVTGRIVGGGGFSRLKGSVPDEGICELQKVYFRSELRGLGFGRQLVEQCMQWAARAGYREMYLETAPQLTTAIALYEKLGFQHLERYKGLERVRGCTVFMSMSLI